MAKVYFWNMTVFRDDAGFGHLSLLLSDGTYVSHWPAKGGGWKKGTTGQRSYQDDVTAEGRHADTVFEIRSGIIDESKIRSWWNKYKTNSEYNLVTNNCAQVVRKALIEGDIVEKLSAIKKIAYYAGNPRGLVPNVTPLDVLMWIQHVVGLHGSFF